MGKSVLALAVVWLLGLSACSGKDAETQAGDTAAEPQHVFKDQVRALDKAKQVEQTIMDTHERRVEEFGNP